MQINSKKNNSITDRIIQILEVKCITKYKFCNDLGLSNGFLDKSREISTGNYAKILEYFPDVNPEWLLIGKGKMLKSANNKGQNIQITGNHNNNSSIIGGGGSIVNSPRAHNSNTGIVGSPGTTVNYTEMGKAELMAILDERFLLLKQKEEQLQEKERVIGNIFEENRMLAAEAAKLTSHIIEQSKEIKELTREVKALTRQLNEQKNSR